MSNGRYYIQNVASGQLIYNGASGGNGAKIIQDGGRSLAQGKWSKRITDTPAPTAIVEPNVTGRYVRIQLAGKGILSLAEVLVLGCGQSSLQEEGIESTNKVTGTTTTPTLTTEIGTTSIESSTKIHHLEVYPNPAKDFLTLNYESVTTGPIELQLFNQVGQQQFIQQQETVEGINQFQIEVSQLTNGTYFLRLVNGQEQLMKKIIILHL